MSSEGKLNRAIREYVRIHSMIKQKGLIPILKDSLLFLENQIGEVKSYQYEYYIETGTQYHDKAQNFRRAKSTFLKAKELVRQVCHPNIRYHETISINKYIESSTAGIIKQRIEKLLRITKKAIKEEKYTQVKQLVSVLRRECGKVPQGYKDIHQLRKLNKITHQLSTINTI